MQVPLAPKLFIKAKDIVDGNEKLNLELTGIIDDDHDPTGSREERAFRMWINTLGIADLYINNLFEDCRDGLTLLKVIDKIEPGTVNWKKVEMKPNNKFKKLSNCNTAISLGKVLKLSLVATGGSDIVEANHKLLLGLTWQLMRFHMLKFLAAIAHCGKAVTEDDILRWANDRVAKSGKHTAIKSFQDSSISSSLFFLDLLAAIEPKIIDWGIVTKAHTDQDKMLNARYAISVARKLGAVMFLLPEDIVEVKHKMCLTFVAAVMAEALKSK
ncbi:fimbrin [Reticulomyxa filosa]|uniref:Fimbrin n=1 Tax=Reticulomyxa filosa TaxID=46433 RepID=X6LX03_RETFI|nr:fimbrin [Reticulomyxa filosa]|eukprot:ETO05861.1 fimbrin [Reticulomyxa filosa]